MHSRGGAGRKKSSCCRCGSSSGAWCQLYQTQTATMEVGPKNHVWYGCWALISIFGSLNGPPGRAQQPRRASRRGSKKLRSSRVLPTRGKGRSSNQTVTVAWASYSGVPGKNCPSAAASHCLPGPPTGKRASLAALATRDLEQVPEFRTVQ